MNIDTLYVSSPPKHDFKMSGDHIHSIYTVCVSSVVHMSAEEKSSIYLSSSSLNL